MLHDKYIIASSKPWHKETCEKDGVLLGDNFLWASSREELTNILENTSNIRYIFFLHWNWVVPDKIWARYECVCFHMTDLPYGRGGSPLQNLIVRGHQKTQLTALRMNGEMDAGPIYAKHTLDLSGTAYEIYIRAGRLSYKIIKWMIDSDPVPTEQTGQPVLFKRRKPGQSELPPSGNISDLYDHIRMLDAPTYPPAFIEYGNFVISFKDAVIEGGELKAVVSIRERADLK